LATRKVLAPDEARIHAPPLASTIPPGLAAWRRILLDRSTPGCKCCVPPELSAKAALRVAASAFRSAYCGTSGVARCMLMAFWASQNDGDPSE
jgi:hypothetical protein